MRQLFVLWTICLLAGLAAGQATVISGYASNQGRPGYYPATPFVPLVTTPSVSLDNASGLLTGASNATLGNVAGGGTRTFSIVGTSAHPPPRLSVWDGTSSPIAPAVRSPEGGTATPSSRHFPTRITP